MLQETSGTAEKGHRIPYKSRRISHGENTDTRKLQDVSGVKPRTGKCYTLSNTEPNSLDEVPIITLTVLD